MKTSTCKIVSLVFFAAWNLLPITSFADSEDNEIRRECEDLVAREELIREKIMETKKKYFELSRSLKKINSTKAKKKALANLETIEDRLGDSDGGGLFGDLEIVKRALEATVDKAVPNAVTRLLETDLIPISDGIQQYWIGRYEVDQALWKAVMGDNPSSSKGAFRPVDSINWHRAQSFLKKLNALPKVTQSGLVFRLPTKYEWSYACHAGATGDYCKLADGTTITEKSLDTIAWVPSRTMSTSEWQRWEDGFWAESDDFDDETEEDVFEDFRNFFDTRKEELRLSDEELSRVWVLRRSLQDMTTSGCTHLVGQKKPNAFGLYDVFGNVSELIGDPSVSDDGFQKTTTYNYLGGNVFSMNTTDQVIWSRLSDKQIIFSDYESNYEVRRAFPETCKQEIPDCICGFRLCAIKPNTNRP